ncbi:hypothetical protein [Candidatus Odyssella acanthamoebae]|uniref:Transglycosylase SLT domain-containing protein n=1 Tax=Candidatus Odyssella acanthamoebae TaxID=91604 RepID=A0A077AU46_9PROT|nr:hypothetical protein [Candidatus Paracaedibacter acanthamoebae]AIK96717.1 hypothetical protein ID47_08280 [Candidatus Paracaedibacter acanthamoebae]
MLTSLKRILFLSNLMSFAVNALEASPAPLNSLATTPILSAPQPSLLTPPNHISADKNLKLETLGKKLTIVQNHLTQEAKNGNRVAQVALIDAYQHNKYGFALTDANQKIILMFLTEFSKNNPLLRPILIRAYKDGDFGINYKRQKNARMGKKLALQYIDSPNIGDLIIEAMTEERLTFKPHLNCLPLIMKLAFEFKNKNAQVFLLRCYITGKYGADFPKKSYSAI